MKRVLSLIIALMVLVTLNAGCGTASQPAADEKTAAASTQQAAPASTQEVAGNDLKPITFTMFSEDPNTNYENMESPVGKKITEKTGVTLKIEYPVGDPKQKISLMAASGDYPDFVYAKGDSNIIVDAKGFIDLRDYIEKYGPNIKKLYGDYLKRLTWSQQDKSIYFFGAYGVNQQQWQPGGATFNLQHAVVKELGYPQLKTVKDYENAIKAYKDKHPTIDGQPTIGLSLLADDWRILISVTNPAVFATGGPDDGEWFVDPNTQKAVLHHTRPEEKEYFKWLNHMNDIGLVDPESFVQKYDQYKAKISSGRVLGILDAKWEYNEAEQALRKAGKDDRMYGQYPIVLDDRFKYHDFQDAGYSAGWGVGITKSCKDPVRAVKFVDWLSTDEAQILNNWGIEGVNYKTENGKRVIAEDEWEKRRTDNQYGKKTGIGVYGYPFPQYGDGVLDPTGQTYTVNSKEQFMVNYTNAEKDVLQHYNAKMWMDIFPKASEFPVKPWGAAWQINIPQNTDAAVIFQKCADIIRKRVPEAIMAKPDKFDGIWDTFQKELEAAGVHKMEEEFNKLLQERLQLWGK